MPEVLSQEEIEQLLAAITRRPQKDGEPDPEETLAEVVALLPNDLAARLQAVIAKWDAELAGHLQPTRLSMECLALLSDRTVQDLLRPYTMRHVAVALIGASENIQDIIRRNLSKRNREDLAQEMTRLSDITETDAAVTRATILEPIEQILRETLHDAKRGL